MWSARNEYVNLPQTRDELETTMLPYSENILSRAMGLIDVVHMKWSTCPSGDTNRTKGKDGYPTVTFLIVGF